MSYTSHADLGGQRGHGPVQPEPEGELWHAPWEPRAMALTVAMGATGAWNIDMSRSARETLPDYASLSYYEIWFAGLQKLLIQRRLLRRAELLKQKSLDTALPLPRALRVADVPSTLARGAPTRRAESQPARFALGDRVRTLRGPIHHHTRLPAYVRGRVGTIARMHGAHIFADTHAHGLGEQPQWLYTVVFDAAQLWAECKGASHQVSVDAWEPYLEPAAGDA
jgi:nitrile hydratase subunit beta